MPFCYRCLLDLEQMDDHKVKDLQLTTPFHLKITLVSLLYLSIGYRNTLLEDTAAILCAFILF